MSEFGDDSDPTGYYRRQQEKHAGELRLFVALVAIFAFTWLAWMIFG